MYEERNSFSIRSLILQILLVLLFVFIMIWLFPTKSYMDNQYVTKDELIQQLESIYGRVYADNVESMRDAAKGYFTNERLPKKVGESVTLTLGEMLEKKLVLEFTDSNGNKCDTEKSYVKVTKMENEYQLKVQLTCTDYSDYIIDYMGCYDYCNECEDTTTEPTVKPTITKKYKYQYKLTTLDTYSNWSNWSNWSTTKVEANNLREVEIEERQEISGYTEKYEITGYKTETYTEYENQTYTEYVSQTKTVADGTKTNLVDSVNPTYSKGYYTEWKEANPVTSEKELYTTDTKEYTLQSTNRYLDCEDSCKYVTEYHYTVRTRKWVSGTPSCPAGYTLEGTVCNKYETVTNYKTVTEQVPVTKTREVPVTKTKQVPVYGNVQGDPIYKTVTYYRYRTRTQLTFASVDYKMSTSKNDSILLGKGYVLTGYYEAV